MTLGLSSRAFGFVAAFNVLLRVRSALGASLESCADLFLLECAWTPVSCVPWSLADILSFGGGGAGRFFLFDSNLLVVSTLLCPFTLFISPLCL